MSEEADAKLRRNEGLKLGATFLNTVASASVAVGVLAPLATSLYGLSSTPVAFQAVAGGAAGWITAALVLHSIAQALLRRLRA